MNEPDFKSYELTAPGRNLVLDAPKIMAILNCTPDSFYDGGRFNAIDSAIERGLDLLDQGADIIDIDGVGSALSSKEFWTADPTLGFPWTRIAQKLPSVPWNLALR